jgi:hypothetical protein
MNCPICNNKSTYQLYSQLNIPLFQNVVYEDEKRAKSAPTSSVELTQCNNCSFIFNQLFRPELIAYHSDYQNEQAHSSFFKQHLENVYNILKKNGIKEKHTIEIGCGKGYFLEYLKRKNINVIGYDPAYEGKNSLIRKEYFTKESNINAEFIILRHTLEHVFKPHDFLKTIAEGNNFKGIIYIEVPTFDWIIQNNAVEDIFYEHCNYFTVKTLANMFNVCETGIFFNGQYIYLIGKLSELKNNIESSESEKPPTKVFFHSKIGKYKKLIEGKSKNIAIWGAGAKGNTFLNLVDKDKRLIDFVVDISPRKQGKFIGGSGHPIIAPHQIYDYSINTIIIMNKNYFDEIKSITKSHIELINLD